MTRFFRGKSIHFGSHGRFLHRRSHSNAKENNGIFSSCAPLINVIVLVWRLKPMQPCIFLNDTVNIGVILNTNSWLGKVVKTALKLAADDVNNDANLVMNATRLLLHFRHAQTLLHAATADIGEAAKVPILSLSATTPSLSHQRFPYLVRMAHSDGLQMKAIAAVVKYYGWRKTVFIHSDVDFGCGAVSLLSDALSDFGSEVVYITTISSTAEKQSIRKELYKLMSIESRVFVVHLPSDLGLNLFMEAQEMGMMKAGYVWITTPGFTSVWEYVLNASTMASMQGLVGIKTHIPNSERLQNFTERKLLFSPLLTTDHERMGNGDQKSAHSRYAR
ncbi:hypothetical protein KI387_025322 [Taxus chinensis]|uniref:Receptor ligand binding region domain-containing protein n=1 Tax=Taxus chinensis TaxID=29808 RepID=A0AA38G765_TAXCH|nr:hypothetical protein KI387_025322 [Taxus chinensis]